MFSTTQKNGEEQLREQRERERETCKKKKKKKKRNRRELLRRWQRADSGRDHHSRLVVADGRTQIPIGHALSEA